MRIKDFFSPSRWKAFIIFLLKKFLGLLEPEAKPYLEQHEIEQLALRFFDDDCSKCLINGNCLHCGCHTEGRMNGWGDSCSAGNWGPIMGKEAWNNYKTEQKITFKVTYNK